MLALLECAVLMYSRLQADNKRKNYQLQETSLIKMLAEVHLRASRNRCVIVARGYCAMAESVTECRPQGWT